VPQARLDLQLRGPSVPLVQPVPRPQELAQPVPRPQEQEQEQAQAQARQEQRALRDADQNCPMTK
jgi:hypothetical protein